MRLAAIPVTAAHRIVAMGQALAIGYAQTASRHSADLLPEPMEL